MQVLRQEGRASDRLTRGIISLHGVRQGIFNQRLSPGYKQGNVGGNIPPPQQPGMNEKHVAPNR
jgi:hypothetical protein